MPAGAAASGDIAGLAADSRTVAGWTLVSRITGFGRVAMVAAVLGPTYFGNLFQTTLLLPLVVYETLIGSLITALLVPPLVRCTDARDRDAVLRLACGLLGVSAVVSSILCALCILAAPLLLSVMALGVDDAEIRQQERQLGWPLLVMFLPQIFLYGVAAIGVAVQHAHRRFALAAAAPAVENVGIMAVMAATALTFGVGADFTEVTTPHLLLLGLGPTAAVGAHAAVQWWGARRLGVPLVPRAGWREPEVRRVVRLAVSSTGYAALNAATHFGLVVAAGSVPGGAIAFQIGYNFFNLPVALCARPVASAQLPRLSRSFHSEAPAAFHSVYRSSLALAIFVALPASLLFVAIPETLARAVAFGEMATPAGVALVAACIAGLGPGIVGDAAFVVATSASYARRDALAPFRAMAARFAIVLAGAAVALAATDGAALLLSLALALSVANVAAAAYLHRSQMRALPAAAHARYGRLLGDLAAAAAAVAAGVLAAGWLGGGGGGAFRGTGVALAAVAASGVVYLAAQWVRGSEELGALLSGLRMVGPDGGSNEALRVAGAAEGADLSTEPPR